jgi:CheY-like chemotaxis protein
MSTPSRSNVLVVNDDFSFQERLCSVLLRAGHRAAAADDAEEAVSLLRAQRFDLIVTDILMPEQDGIAFVQALRAIGCSTPVIGISSQAGAVAAPGTTAAPAVAPAPRTFEDGELLDCVDSVLDVVAARRGSAGRPSVH